MAVARRTNAVASEAPEKLELSEGQREALSRLREIASEGPEIDDLDGCEDNNAPGENGVALDEATAHLRIIEALLFASPKPLSEKQLAEHLPDDAAVGELVQQLRSQYSGRGIELVKVAGKWAFRTAEDLSYLLERYAVEQRRLSKAALETLAIIAYHQPVTRAEIEEIRGVQTSRGTLDVLMEANWIRPRGRRRAPGKPVTYGTTDEFLSHFGLAGLGDLPGMVELKASGMLDADLPPGFTVPDPKDIAALMPDELPFEEEGDADGEAADDLEEPGDDGEEADEIPASPRNPS